MDFDVYVSTANYPLAVDPKSAIIGSPARQWLEDREALIDGRSPRQVAPDTNLVIDYEGNRFGAGNMQTFCDRAVVAAGRHKAHYPTVARMIVPRKRLIAVAKFAYEREELHLLDRGALMAWLEVDEAQFAEELRATSVRALRASGI